jgi:hypothetical protein
VDKARSELVLVLQEARLLLAQPGNDFAWSSWGSSEEALQELDAKIAAIEAGVLPDRLDLAVLFGPTGPIQEVSISSGWSLEFLNIVRRFDWAVERVYN